VRKSVVYPGVKPEEDLRVYYLTDVWCYFLTNMFRCET
jgi:hypothetical protein